MKNGIINELKFASKKKKNAVLGYVYCDYLLDMFEEIERLNNIKQDLLYVLSQLDGYLDKGWAIDLNFTDIREKYKKDIDDYENWN